MSNVGGSGSCDQCGRGQDHVSNVGGVRILCAMWEGGSGSCEQCGRGQDHVANVVHLQTCTNTWLQTFMEPKIASLNCLLK